MDKRHIKTCKLLWIAFTGIILAGAYLLFMYLPDSISEFVNSGEAAIVGYIAGIFAIIPIIVVLFISVITGKKKK